MGLCCPTQDDHTNLIDRGLKQNRKADAQVKKLLLLGPGGSGKSTIYNQLTLLHGSGMPDYVLRSYRNTVHGNILDAIRILIKRSQDLDDEDPKLGTRIRDDAQPLAEEVETYKGRVVTEDLGHKIGKLWRDRGIWRTFQLRTKFELEDQCKYYFENLDRIARPEYIPTISDVLRVRVKTTGIKEQEFELNKRTFRIVDVGGQRNERSKWIHCFHSVTGVIFVCALNAYDQGLCHEQNSGDREKGLLFTLDLFEEAVNSPWFYESAIILFLNKRDLYQEKIGATYTPPSGSNPMKVPLSVCFPDCPVHDQDPYTQGIEYIRNEFLKRVHGKNIHIHVTCATDTTNVHKVFQDVHHQVIKLALQKAALLAPDMPRASSRHPNAYHPLGSHPSTSHAPPSASSSRPRNGTERPAGGLGMGGGSSSKFAGAGHSSPARRQSSRPT